MKFKAPRSLNRSPGYQSITVCSHKHCMKENFGSKNKFDSTIMFGTSNYQKISIFSEIGHSWHFCDMAAILKKKWRLQRTIFKYYHHVRHIKLPQDINFHWNRTKLKFSRIGGHFEKKMTARKKNLIVPSCSPHQKQHIPIWITSLTIILSEISNVKVKKFEKTALKGQ